jgi:hypothetical protein
MKNLGHDSDRTFTKFKLGTKCYLYYSCLTDYAETDRRYVPVHVRIKYVAKVYVSSSSPKVVRHSDLFRFHEAHI